MNQTDYKDTGNSPAVRLRAGLELIRPANIITALADILAGFAAAGGTVLFLDGSFAVEPNGLHWLLLATVGLYGGGVVFNDVFDAELDADERPERAIPSGRISKKSATLLGGALLVTGVLSAFQVSDISGFIALAIGYCAMAYDARAKHSVFWGPLFMGLCRGGNLLLGVSLIPAALFQLWPLACIPVLYIASITLISQGEVKGAGSRTPGILALLSIFAVLAALLLLSLLPDYRLLHALPFVILFAAIVTPPFLKAAKVPDPKNIRKAVSRGVLSLILLNSALTAGFAGILMGILVLLLLPLSMILARMFAVT